MTFFVNENHELSSIDANPTDNCWMRYLVYPVDKYCKKGSAFNDPSNLSQEN